jgi:hypothetical protein
MRGMKESRLVQFSAVGQTLMVDIKLRGLSISGLFASVY